MSSARFTKPVAADMRRRTRPVVRLLTSAATAPGRPMKLLPVSDAQKKAETLSQPEPRQLIPAFYPEGLVPGPFSPPRMRGAATHADARNPSPQPSPLHRGREREPERVAKSGPAFSLHRMRGEGGRGGRMRGAATHAATRNPSPQPSPLLRGREREPERVPQSLRVILASLRLGSLRVPTALSPSAGFQPPQIG
jgi:hypothetical protein